MKRILIAASFAVLFACGPKPMQFRVLSFPDEVLTSGLEAASKDGWEVVSTRRALADGSGVYEMVCRRPASMGPASPHIEKLMATIAEVKRKADAEFAAEAAAYDAAAPLRREQQEKQAAADNAAAAIRALEAHNREMAARQPPAPSKPVTLGYGPDGRPRIHD